MLPADIYLKEYHKTKCQSVSKTLPSLQAECWQCNVVYLYTGHGLVSSERLSGGQHQEAAHWRGRGWHWSRGGNQPRLATATALGHARGQGSNMSQLLQYNNCYQTHYQAYFIEYPFRYVDM